MPDAAFKLEDLPFGVGQHGGEEIGGLRGQGFSGRLAHGDILFERLVVFFCFPPSLVNRGHLSMVQVGVAADQIQQLATVLVDKNLFTDELVAKKY